MKILLEREVDEKTPYTLTESLYGRELEKAGRGEASRKGSESFV